MVDLFLKFIKILKFCHVVLTLLVYRKVAFNFNSSIKILVITKQIKSLNDLFTIVRYFSFFLFMELRI